MAVPSFPPLSFNHFPSELLTNPAVQHDAGANEAEAAQQKNALAATPASSRQDTPLTNQPGAFKGLALRRKMQAIEGRVVAKVRDGIDRHYSTFRGRVGAVPLLRVTVKDMLVDQLAWNAVDQTMRQVPAYNEFLKDQGVGELRDWRDVPVMTKKNYIQKYPATQILVGGKFPEGGQMDQSSGSTGEPSRWYRNVKEGDETGRVMRHAMRASIKGNKPIMINTFSHGLWATGITVTKSLGKVSLMMAMNADLEKSIAQIKIAADNAAELGIKANVIVAGYPPFLQTVAENLTLTPTQKEHMKLWAVGGGEPITPTRRQNLKDRGFDEVRSSYGASDLTVNIGAQDEYDVQIEDLCNKNPELCMELFGRSKPPSVFHYDPGSYKILQSPVQDEEGNTISRLLFTQLKKVTCPKINYDLGDEGGTLLPAEVKKILAKHGVAEKDMPDRLHALPMLYLWGRAGSAVTYSGSKVTPDHMLLALSKTEEGRPAILDSIDNYALNEMEVSNGHSHLRFLLQAKKGVPAESLETPEVRDSIIDALRAENQDFNEAVRLNGREDISLAVFEHGTGPKFHPNVATKKQYIFRGPLMDDNNQEIRPVTVGGASKPEQPADSPEPIHA